MIKIKQQEAMGYRATWLEDEAIALPENVNIDTETTRGCANLPTITLPESFIGLSLSEDLFGDTEKRRTACNENGELYRIEAEGAEAKHIAELLAAEAQSRLIVLPIPVGEGIVAYGIDEDKPDHIVTIECEELDGLERWPSGEIVVSVDGWEIGSSDIGKTVFFSYQDAAAALKPMPPAK